jgi:hypothetical protein
VALFFRSRVGRGRCRGAVEEEEEEDGGFSGEDDRESEMSVVDDG